MPENKLFYTNDREVCWDILNISVCRALTYETRVLKLQSCTHSTLKFKEIKHKTSIQNQFKWELNVYRELINTISMKNFLKCFF